jgi:hypothetical protein
MKHFSTYLPVRLILAFSVAVATVAPPKSSAQIVVTIGPPQIPVDAQPPSPGGAFVWAPGHWGRNPSGYAWIHGSWLMPPSPGMLWTPGYWRPQPGGFAWQSGRWGSSVGYYGGVNYGFGYMGSGFTASTLRHDEIRHEVQHYRADGGGRLGAGSPPSYPGGDHGGNWNHNGQGSQPGHAGNAYGGGRPNPGMSSGSGNTGGGAGPSGTKGSGSTGSGAPAGAGNPGGPPPTGGTTKGGPGAGNGNPSGGYNPR